MKTKRIETLVRSMAGKGRGRAASGQTVVTLEGTDLRTLKAKGELVGGWTGGVLFR